MMASRLLHSALHSAAIGQTLQHTSSMNALIAQPKGYNYDEAMSSPVGTMRYPMVRAAPAVCDGG